MESKNSSNQYKVTVWFENGKELREILLEYLLKSA